ncbi:MAG TPA: pirin family protein [Bacteroidales bacterium]|nr:pirin family protein [Bacteroidales bacterium]
MTKILHRAEDRGSADHGWLQTNHNFSFASWYDPERTNFGALRVLNDDFVAPGKGFGTHPHDNMEIISIPLAGKLEHRDDMGNGGVISEGEIQIMSAGTGIHHSEFNPSPAEMVNFLQIWIFPRIRNIEPRYDQVKYSRSALQNNIITLISPDLSDETLWINQNAFVSLSKPENGKRITYKKKLAENGVYIFIISGRADIDGESLQDRDAIGITGPEELKIHAVTDSFLLLIEVPVKGF